MKKKQQLSLEPELPTITDIVIPDKNAIAIFRFGADEDADEIRIWQEGKYLYIQGEGGFGDGVEVLPRYANQIVVGIHKW